MKPFEFINGEEVSWPEEEFNYGLAASIKGYVEESRPVGHFLRGVLANDLTEAAMRADLDNARSLVAIAKFVYWNVPSSMRGSKDVVEARIGKP